MISTHSNQVAIVSTSVIFSCLTITSVCMRLFARIRIIHNSKLDDAVLFLSLIAMLTFTALVCAQLPYGLGKPISTVDEADIVKLVKLLWYSILAYNISLAATKTSILLQYLRFVSGPKTRAFCWIMIFVAISYGFIAVIDTIFLCRPISGFWYPARAKSCLNKKVLWLCHSGINIMSDLIIFVIPVPTLWQLKMAKLQRFGVILIFTIGGVVCLITILRLNSLISVSRSPDITYQNTFAAIWSNAEITVALFCASLAGIKPIFRGVFSANPTKNSRPTDERLSLCPVVELPDHETAKSVEAAHHELQTREFCPPLSHSVE